MGTEGHEAESELRGTHIGHGVYIRFTGIHSEPDDVKGGIMVSHRHADGAVCSGFVTFDVPANAASTHSKWTVESWDPLTISPSVLDKSCGLHGHIRNGRWEPC